VSDAAGGIAVHATAIVVGEHGILIRGPAGAGKSSLARDILARAEGLGGFAALVSDDRVRLSAASGRVVASAPAPIAGLLEIRGIGLVRVPHEPAAVLRLVVDLDGEAPRMAEPAALAAEIAGMRLPRVTLRPGCGPDLILWALQHHDDRFVTIP
jgi:serine kinase of HPr protein (carbohydrate metabolism regulator)